MKEQSIKNLTVTALGLQAAALVLTILMTIGQQSIKMIFSADDKITEIFSIPLEALIKIIPVLILYIVGTGLVCAGDVQKNRTKVVVVTVIAGVFQVLPQYFSVIGQWVIGTEGVYALASYSTLQSVVSWVVNPFIWAAFAVFCIACGGCFGVKTKEADNQSAYGVYGYNENFKME